MADRVRLSLFCPSCVPGYHLPFFSGAITGLFADHGLIVDILDPPPPPGTTNSVRVASGGAEFGLTGVTYFLTAKKEAGDHFPARFISMLHQSSPLGAIVAANSDLDAPADLQGRRLGRGEMTGWLADECQQGMADRGLAPMTIVPLANGQAPYALGRGEIDVMGTFIDSMPGAGTKGGHAVRGIPLGAPIYSSGILAGDHVPLEIAARMQNAVAGAFEEQRKNPAAGIAEFCERFPEVRPEDARAGWDLLVPYAFTGPDVGLMEDSRWATTLDWLTATHGLPEMDPSGVYRPELAKVSVAA